MSESNNNKCYRYPFEKEEEVINERREKIKECRCGNGSSSTDGDDCIATWKKEKSNAKGTLDKAIAKVNSASEALKYANEWEAKLKAYFDKIYATSEMADKVARELSGLKAQVGDVCTNADCTITAIEILFCEVKDIFEPCVRMLIDVMDRVKECIKCITDPGLVRDEGIVLVLMEYDAKLRELEALQKDTLEKIIEAMKCANILYYAICRANEKNQEAEEFRCDSLANELIDLCEKFGTGGSDSDQEAMPCVADPLTCNSLTDGCNSAVGNTLGPVPVFPLSEDDYFKNTECQHGKAKSDKEDKKKTLDKAKKGKEAAQACYDSLTTAIDTAEKAKKGK